MDDTILGTPNSALGTADNTALLAFLQNHSGTGPGTFNLTQSGGYPQQAAAGNMGTAVFGGQAFPYGLMHASSLPIPSVNNNPGMVNGITFHNTPGIANSGPFSGHVGMIAPNASANLVPVHASASNIPITPEVQAYIAGEVRKALGDSDTPNVAAGVVQQQRQRRDPGEEVSDQLHGTRWTLTLIHSKMLALLGVSKNGLRKLPILPHPLGPGDEPRMTSLDERLFNPEWNESVTHPTNMLYLERAVELLIDDGVVTVDQSKRMLGKAKKYFHQLKTFYNSCNDEQANQKREKKVVKGRRNNRKKAVSHGLLSKDVAPDRLEQKAKDLRNAIPSFKSFYGESETRGIEAAVQTDFMSSEISDNEATIASARTKVKVLKVVPIGWRSTQLLRLHARLRQLRAEDDRLSNSSQVYHRVVASNFEGADEKKPPIKKAVFQEWVSKGWLERTKGNYKFPQNTDKFTVLKLRIPDEDLADHDAAALADDEASDDE
ncbi:hypothetical protein H0H93_015718 [Arthromyces matolae]|nr:hypothetical protein H0H93_015718 [Arthromyces matolae]